MVGLIQIIEGILKQDLEPVHRSTVNVFKHDLKCLQENVCIQCKLELFMKNDF